MGIPSYFSYIIKNHSNIIRSLTFHTKQAKTIFHSLYMDCNSIVYDVVHVLEKTTKYTRETNAQFEQTIIQQVIAKIREHIACISPKNVVYIAFDGVAPLAKMKQQRNRRYKSAYMALVNFDDVGPRLRDKPLDNKWDTVSITPGTEFMKKLTKQIRDEFIPRRFLNVKTLIVSASDEPGEGEHKMFQYIRENVGSHENVAVYGLDSDLIMLSIFHSFSCRNIYVCREAPQFAKNILPSNIRFGENELMFLDAQILSLSILNEMKCVYKDKMRIYDYVFMCFFLGNDFLPHFPAFNIRRNGMQQIIDIYSNIMGKYPDRFFIQKDTFEIQWKWVNLFIKELAELEHSFLVEEYTYRNKMSNRKWSENTPEEREIAFQNAPMIYRGDEHYICPTEEGWEDRYYRIICKPYSKFAVEATEGRLVGKSDTEVQTKPVEHTPELINKMCASYLEMLEWVLSYYISGKCSLRKAYEYDDVPLMKDISRYERPKNLENVYDEDDYKWYDVRIQQLYVMPTTYFYSPLCNPEDETVKLQRKIIENNKSKFPPYNKLKYEGGWLFKKYLWEALLKMPEISRSELKKWENEICSKVCEYVM